MIQYRVYKIDENHLAKSEFGFDTEKRICLRQAKFMINYGDTFDSIEEAIQAINKEDWKYEGFLILPYYYSRPD